MIGVLKTIRADISIHARSMGNCVGTSFLAFKTLSSISDQYSTTPLLQAPFSGGSKQSHVLWAWILYTLLKANKKREAQTCTEIIH
jgi:hypothetical protein